MSPGALNCPHCGAAITPGSTQCPFCSSLLQTVACTRCHARMFAGVNFCPHCGAPAVEVEVGRAGSDACPRCLVPLVAVRVANSVLDQCPRCAGLWMGLAVFDRICADAQAGAAASGLLRPAAPDPLPQVRYLDCPRCAQPMGRVNYARGSGVLINVCRSHGVWLDGDQLRQIMEFIASGGLDRARRNEMEHLESRRRALEFERRLYDAREMTGGDAAPEA